MKATKLLAAALVACFPVFTHAQGWYAGVDVGGARSDAKIEEYVLFGGTTARASGSTTAFRVRGGYQLGRYWAFEVAYVDLGEVKSHFDPTDCPNGAPGPCPFDVRTSLDGLIGTIMGILPIGEHWYVDARVGWGKMNVKVNQVGGEDLDGDHENPAFHYGIGGGYRFDNHWELMLDFTEYNQEDFGDSLAGDFGVYNLGETSVTSLGISYHW